MNYKKFNLELFCNVCGAHGLFYGKDPLQIAKSENWIVTKNKNVCSYCNDKK